MKLIENIKRFFSTYNPKDHDKRKKYALFLPIVIHNNEEYMLFEQRSKLIEQPGDICFPGGKVEKGETYEKAAIRECSEELGVSLDDIKVFGPTDRVVTLLGNPIYSFVGEIKNFSLDNLNLSPEVSKVHLVKLKDIYSSNPEKYKCILNQERPDDFPYELIENGRNYKFSRPVYYHYFYRFNGDLIVWGLTAKVLRNFIINMEDVRNNTDEIIEK